MVVDRATGHHYIRRGDFASWIRRERQVKITAAAVTGRLAEVGVETFNLQEWPPDTPRSEGGHVIVRCYRWSPQQ